ncbi:MAG TPA: GNAT family N-acetyltransferase [Xanthobacteraceae bacterium]
MAYRYRIFNSIADVQLDHWEQVRSACGGSIVMDPRFISAVEASMKQVPKFWYIIVYDEENLPVACASASVMTLDIMDIADPAFARVIRYSPLRFSRLRDLRIFIGGLPIGTAHHILGIARQSAGPQVIPFVDRLMRDLATSCKADLIVYKEFGKEDLEWTQPLLELGYRRIPTPPMHFFRSDFPDFAHYCAALKTRYRQQINRSTRKLGNSRLATRVLTDPDEMLRAYTPEVHALYRQMADRATFNPDVLPIDLLHELASRLRGNIDLIAIFMDDRIVAFGWCLHTDTSYHMMYAGLDYQLNNEFDLYFNLMYAGLDRALRKRVSTIEVGLGADDFKARLGCYSEPLYIFVRGCGPLMSLIVRAAGNLLLLQKPSPAPNNIFRRQVARSPR